jgi:hypothetical protein
VAIDQDPLEVNIEIVRSNPKGCCGNDTVEPGEQCDGALAATDCGGNPLSGTCGGVDDSFVCFCDCLAKEILLSAPGPISNNAPGTKFDLQLAFHGTQGSGEIAGALRAVFGDTNGQDISIVTLTQDLFPVGNPAWLSDASAGFPQPKQLRPRDCANMSGSTHAANEQRQPEIARIAPGLMAVVYASNQILSNRYDVWLHMQGPDGCGNAQTPPLQLNVGTPSNTACTFPAVAGGPESVALVVWNEAGALNGRIVTQMGSGLGAELALTPAGDHIALSSVIEPNTRPRVAGNDDGWVIAYATTGGDIALRTVSLAGEVGDETIVNTGTGAPIEPDAAMLPDGRFAVVWNDESRVRYQRFSASGVPVEGDQAGTANVDSPGVGQPAIAAAESGDFYAVGWA